MKTFSIIIFCLAISGFAFSQVEKETIYKNVDQVNVIPPKFTGVENASSVLKNENYKSLNNYLSSHVQYPEEAVKFLKCGTEVIRFVVSPEGNLSDFVVINSVCPEIDKEVIRILEGTNGMWITGYNDDTPVAMEREVSVVFKLSDMKNRSDFMTRAKKYFLKGTDLFITKSEPGKALKQFNKIILLLPNDESTLLWRGLCKYELNDKDGAFADWNRLKNIGGTDPSDAFMSDNMKTLKGYGEMISMLKK